MKIDPMKVATEVAVGTSYVCAMCTKYWEGKEIRSLGKRLNIVRDGQLCTAQDGCGSPFAGDVFHEYDGPLVEFESFCFVCGGQSTHGVRVRNLVRVIGVCDKHSTWIKDGCFRPHFKKRLKEVDWKNRELIS